MPRKKLRIVVIDDNPADAGILRRNLDKISSLEILLTHYLDGVEGRDAVLRDGADCLLLDHELGVPNGMEILTQIRQAGCDIPVIAVTGHGDEAIAADTFRRGAQEYLVKSRIDPATIEDTIRSAIGKVADERRRRDKEQELESFVSIVAHDLQQPLCAIKGNLDLLHDFCGDCLGEDGRKFVASAARMSARMSEMIEGLLSYSRVGRGQAVMRPVQLQQCLQGVLAELGPMLQETNAEVRAGQLPTVWGDPLSLSQLLQNLIVNALKFHSERTPVVEIGAQRESTAWHLWVNDNGVGVDSKHHEAIFAPFTRVDTKNGPKGSGIGLATCKKIIEQHQGRIWIESSVGAGATFHFLLGTAEDDSAPRPEQAQGRVLVVEDEKPIRALLEEGLGYYGYDVVGTAGLGETLQLAAENRFDLVITGLVLPDGSGLDVIRAVRERNPDARIIVVSGASGGLAPGPLFRDAKLLGAEKLFLKPFHLSDVASTVGELMRERVADWNGRWDREEAPDLSAQS
jgi:signal transduction histidine kinase